MSDFRVVIASNSFKNSCSALEACNAIAKGIDQTEKNIEYYVCPLADGGDGTLEVLKSIERDSIEIIREEVIGPLGHVHTADYGIYVDNSAAIIEQSSACGICWIPEERCSAWLTHTYALGQLISKVYKQGIRHVILTLGGSASIDIGLGLLQALGLKCSCSESKKKIFVPEDFKEIKEIVDDQLSKYDHNLKFTVLVDVNNLFFGEYGAVRKFGKQKGVEFSEMPIFEENLNHVITLLEKKTHKKTTHLLGSGAGGGVLVGLASYFDVSVLSGANYVAKKHDLESKIKNANLVITGEGTWDDQTNLGKGPGYVVSLAKKHKVPIVGFFGKVGSDTSDFLDTIRISDFSVSLNENLKLTEPNLIMSSKIFFSDFLK